jgi:YHS domain-containing protein
VRIRVNERESVKPFFRVKGVHMMKDPVCGMDVDEKKAPSSNYQGKQYAFCSPECKKTFDQHPEKYAGATKREKVGKT